MGITIIGKDEEYYDFLVKAKESVQNKTSGWFDLSEKFFNLFHYRLSPEQLRKRCYRYAKSGSRKHADEGRVTLSPKTGKREEIKEEVSMLNDGSICAMKIVEYVKEIFGDRKKLLEYLGYDPKQWVIEDLKFKIYEAPKKGEEAPREMASVHVKLKPVNITNASDELFIEAANKLYMEKIIPNPRVEVKKIYGNGKDDSFNRNKLILLPAIEAHLGKLSHTVETGVNYDYKICSERVRKVFNETVKLQDFEHASNCLLVIGGDFFNSESTGTTSAGTPQESTDTRYIKMFNKGQELYTEGIELLRTRFEHVDVILCAGNHSRGAEFALYKVLKAYFRNCKDVTFSDNYRYTQAVTFGKNCLFFNHGDPNQARLIRSIAAEFPEEWGQTIYRYLFVGHLHKLEITDTENGLMMHRVPAICENDAWHYTNRFGIGIQPMHEIMVFSGDTGMTSQHFITFKQEKI